MTTQTDAARSTPEAGSVADLYREVLPMLEFTAEATKIDVALTVAPGDLHEVIAAGRDDARLSMDLLRNLTAVDWQDDGIELVYHLYSLRQRHGVCVKTRLEGEAPSIATITDLYMGAEWAEREVREMFGVEFEGHPDPRNLLLDEDLDIHPLLKSHPLAEIELPQGVDVEYFTKEHPPERRAAPDAGRAAAAAKQAADEKKPASDLTPEELAAKRAAQAERVQKARELAAARRREGPKTPMGEKAAAAPAAATDAPASGGAAPPAPAPAATPAPTRSAAPAAPAPTNAAAKKATADMTPEELAERKQAQAERVKRARELAAARRAELRGEG